MAKRKSVKIFSKGSSGINYIPGMGSGGVFFNCSPDDTSLFCKFSMFFKVIMMIVALFAVGVMLKYLFTTTSLLSFKSKSNASRNTRRRRR